MCPFLAILKLHSSLYGIILHNFVKDTQMKSRLAEETFKFKISKPQQEA